VARELTKLHEELVRDTLMALAERFADGARGEVTIVVSGASEDAAGPGAPDDLDSEVRARLAAGETPRDVAAALARARGLPRREVYARVTALREER
jgi:16S rRNA (cytidine1402-2'-O)-methyltransferase